MRYGPAVSRRPLDDEALREAVRSPGYRPARADLPALFERFDQSDDRLAEAAERALARLGMEAAEAALARFDGSEPPARARLVRLVARVSQGKIGADERRPLIDFLVHTLADSDAKARRHAIQAIGKLGDAELEAPLLARFVAGPEEDLPERRALVTALGKVGGAAALDALDEAGTDDKELGRILDEARLRLRRTLGRKDEAGRGEIDLHASAAAPLRVLLHAREGLASLVAKELGSSFSPRCLDDATVEAKLGGELGALYRARTALRFGFPLPVTRTGDPGEALVAALTSDAALDIFRSFTKGPYRYRIEWASAGRRRGLTYRVAEAVAAKRPELLNDPTESLWEVVVDETRGLGITLWPRGLDDPRFRYRRAHVPASSHPTIAAALALIGEAREDDVVWDPFVGGGTELVERARLGPYRRMIVTDLDPQALEQARINLEAAGLEGVALEVADARRFQPRERPTLILTNPPMGRRVLDKTKTGPLYDAFLGHVASILRPGGRLVWISPRPRDTLRRAEAVGLTSTLRRKVDMGGFYAEIQRFESVARNQLRP
jgi:precorrin-6B methylase 2